MSIQHEETLPNGIYVFQDVPAFGERKWYAQPPGCCGLSSGYTREQAIANASKGCKWCDAPPVVDANNV